VAGQLQSRLGEGLLEAPRERRFQREREQLGRPRRRLVADGGDPGEILAKRLCMSFDLQDSSMTS